MPAVGDLDLVATFIELSDVLNVVFSGSDSFSRIWSHGETETEREREREGGGRVRD